MSSSSSSSKRIRANFDRVRQRGYALRYLRANGNRVLIPFVLRYRNTTLVFLASDKRSKRIVGLPLLVGLLCLNAGPSRAVELFIPYLPPARRYAVALLPVPAFLVRAGYWTADNERQGGFGNSSGMFCGEVEALPFENDTAFGLSTQAMGRNPSSQFWDGYLRLGSLKVGLRREDLRRSDGSELHCSSFFGGTGFGLPVGKKLALDFDLLGGSTFLGIPEQQPNRLIADWSLTLSYRPIRDINLFLGYRDFLFGTSDEVLLFAKRSRFFGSYEGLLFMIETLF